MQKIWENFKSQVNQIFYISELDWLPRMFILAFITGVIGGLAAVGFNELIQFFHWIFYGAQSRAALLDSIRALPLAYRLVAPAIGGLIVGPMVTYIIKAARGHGVPTVMEAVGLRRGVIPFRVAPYKALLAAITIGSGGSAGQFGPIVHIGSALGSSIGRFFKLTPERAMILLAGGAAAGIAGTFNAPMAGVIFSVEIILRKIKMQTFLPIIIASLTGTVVANTIYGRTGPVFDISFHPMVSYWDLLFYVGLGIFTAIVALIYTNLLYGVQDLFEKVPVPVALKAAIGGLMVGGLALLLPEIKGTGFPIIGSALLGFFPLGLVFALMAGKILATSLTLGSGGSGGVFGPALFIGAMAGSGYGMVAGMVFPEIAVASTSYSMVGMGALFAGATHAPLTAILIIFELTRDPRTILPLMMACVISTFIASRVQKTNIYTKKILQ